MTTHLEQLYARIIQRVNINLREFDIDVRPIVQPLVSFEQLQASSGYYGISIQHPLDFQFIHSNLAGSYFLGRCRTANSILYKSDIRGDELKKRGSVFHFGKYDIPLTKDEGIHIEDSLLIKTLVHNHSHDPETPERFPICSTIAAHYANIHGSPMDGSFLEPCSTVDLTTMNDCIVGAYSYVQVGELNHFHVAPGTIWIRKRGRFNFLYRYSPRQLRPYVQFSAGKLPAGLFLDIVRARKKDFQRIFETVNIGSEIHVPSNASLDRFAVIKPKVHIGENVLVAQRSCLVNSELGTGANAQENCFIINSRLEGYNVTAHGAKIICCDLGKRVFVGFNSLLRGRDDQRLVVGEGSIIMPHTIIDTIEPIVIPEHYLVWGLVTCPGDLAANSISFEKLQTISNGFSRGKMFFEGSGADFFNTFHDRIQHILEANGAFYNGEQNEGHAQRNQNISFNMIQPYPEGEYKGIYPTISIQP